MLTEERVNELGLGFREVGDDDVNFLAARLMRHDGGEEGDELGRGMPRAGLAQHFTGLGIEGGVQRERSMPEVLKAMTLGTPRRERQHRVFAIEDTDSCRSGSPQADSHLLACSEIGHGCYFPCSAHSILRFKSLGSITNCLLASISPLVMTSCTSPRRAITG